MKLLVDAQTDKVLGASMCGPDAAEIMQVYLVRLCDVCHKLLCCKWCNVIMIYSLELPNN